MTRLVRVGAYAVLSVLCLFAQAGTGRASQLGGPGGLQAARMFNPLAESLFATLNGSARLVSPMEIALFNIAPAQDAAFTSATQTAAPHGSGMANVTFGIPRVQVAYSRYAASQTPVRVPAPRVGAPPANLAPARENISDPVQDAATLHTAPPAPLPSQSAVRFGEYTPYTPQLQGIATGVDVPGRIGKMHFETAFHAMQLCGTADEAAACTAAPEAAAQSFTAGTDFNVVGSVKLGLSSSLEHLNNATSNMFPYVPLDPDAQAGLTYFGLTNVVSQSVGAQVAVPVNRQITVGLQYDRAHYQGDYGNTLLPGFDASKDTYLGNVTYQLPNTSSAITLSARQYRYQDAFSPNFNLTETRADLNYTVKF